MSGAIPPLPNTPSWRGAQLKHRDNFTFTFKHIYFELTPWSRVLLETLIVAQLPFMELEDSV
jgi:hypothetical protein